MATLLETYIVKKIRQYKEPSRQGTPKGDPVGFMRPKYAAALWCLYDVPLKVVAEKAGVSEGLIRKWRTERNFKDAIFAAAQGFVPILAEHIKKSKTGFEDYTKYSSVLQGMIGVHAYHNKDKDPDLLSLLVEKVLASEDGEISWDSMGKDALELIAQCRTLKGRLNEADAKLLRKTLNYAEACVRAKEKKK